MQLTPSLRHLGYLSVMLAVCLAPAAPAADLDVAEAIEGREKSAAASAEFVYRLGLSRAQARKLIPILEEAAAIHIEGYDAEAALLPRMIDASADDPRPPLPEGETGDAYPLAAVARSSPMTTRSAVRSRGMWVNLIVVLSRRQGTPLTKTNRCRG